MAQSKANCKFCSRTDNSIQVICETRCLICSRCQLMPGIRKLLIDHSTLMVTQNQTQVCAGCCPICESPMSPSMLALIESFKEYFRKIQSEDNNAGKLGAEVELEEVSTIITSFLKRFRNTYEMGADGKTPTTDKATATTAGANQAALSAAMTSQQAKSRSNLVQTVDLAEMYNNPGKASASSVLEFIAECYLAQWQSVLRNCNESMVTILMRLTNRKKFSQRTNDFKAKSLIDFMSSSASGCETPDLLLFGRLTGLQPKPTCNISTAWSHIAVSVIVAANCDRCLKMGHLNDVTGNPTVNELRQKLAKSAGVGASKCISLRRAIKIVQLLGKAQHPHWTMSPLAPACIEYSCKLPWRDDSISKLLNVLLFVALYEPSSAPPSAAPSSSAGGRRGSTLPSIPSTPAGEGGEPMSGRNRSRSILRSSGSDFGALGDFTGNPVSAAASAAHRLNSRMQLLKTLDTVAQRLWSGSASSAMTASQDKHVLLDYFSKLEARRHHPSFARLDFDKALALVDGQTILVSELALVCIECWEVEYAEVKVAIARGKLTSQRRKAISGNYDSSHAKLTAVERLALVRLLHWYSVEGESGGIDWDDVDAQFRERLFPFAVPASLLLKPRNELHHLSVVVWAEVQAQRQRDELEDAEAEGGPYSAAHRHATHGAHTEQGAPTDFVTMEEIERYNREQYLASQSIGYAGPAFDGYVDEEAVDAFAEKHKMMRSHTVADMSSRLGHAPLRPTGSFDVFTRPADIEASLAFVNDSVDVLQRTDALTAKHNALVTGDVTVGGLRFDSLSPFHTQDLAQPGARPKTPLAKLPYASPAPGPHPVNLVDVIGLGGGVLGNVKLVPNNNHGHGAALSPRRTKKKVASTATPDAEVRGRDNAPPVAPADKTQQADQEASDKYSEMHATHQKSKVQAARSRIKSRITAVLALKKAPTARGDELTALADTDPVVAEKESSATPQINYLTTNTRVTPVLDLSPFVSQHGSFTLDLTTHLTSETAVKYLALKSANISLQGFQYVLDNYTKPWQLAQMVRLDVDGNPELGIAGARILSSKLAICCRLVHLNMSGLRLGDNGLRSVLNGVIAGGGESHLLRLDVSSNGITMVSDSFAILGRFTSLRALDLSRNCFTLDTTSQFGTFRSSIAPLVSLQALSLAYNKIQHDGFALVCELVETRLHALRQLDVACCFISSRSYPVLVHLLQTAVTDAGAVLTSSNGNGAQREGLVRLEEVMFQQNLFSYAQLADLHAEYGNRPDMKVSLNMPHLGIAYPLRYDMRDHGIEVYRA